VRHDIVLVKYWLAISKDEQHRRFKQREKVQAVCDMVERTSTRVAPWTLVENNKYYARIKVLRTLCEALEKAL
jgi:polyphosphate kinase 2 (PPK2 family)